MNVIQVKNHKKRDQNRCLHVLHLQHKFRCKSNNTKSYQRLTLTTSISVKRDMDKNYNKKRLVSNATITDVPLIEFQ